jgi:hypothetical protein
LAGNDNEIDSEIDFISQTIDENRSMKQMLTAELECARSIASCKTFDEQSARELLRQRMSQFYTVMTSNVSLARHALKLLLTSKISVSPVPCDGKKGFEFSGKTVVGNLLSDLDPEPEPDVSMRRGGNSKKLRFNYEQVGSANATAIRWMPSAPLAANRVGDGITPVALPHHRTCGSASGGSLNTLESSHCIEQRHQT